MKSSNKPLIKCLIVAIIICIIAFVALVIYNFVINPLNNSEPSENTTNTSSKKSDTLVVPIEGQQVEKDEKEKIYGYDENAMQVSEYYNGFQACGFLEIPKIGLSLPVLSNQTVKGMEYSCCMLYSTGTINLSGNTYIVGHNKNNGTLFSNNKKLGVGDKIVLTGLYKNRIEYIIYNVFNTTADDTSYLTKYVNDNDIELTIQTCNNDKADTRLIIQAIHHIKK